jgi:HD-GYP domain-containing protein (c-di-GMP phosphodiesterase class II)
MANMAELAANTELFPIAVETVNLKRIPPMDIYLQRESDGQYVLFLSRSLPLDEEDFAVLKEREDCMLWVHENDFQAYEDFLNYNVLDIIHDKSIPVETKCELTYNASTEIMHKVFESPDPESVIEASEKVLTPVIEVIFGDHTAAHQFILQSSTDFHLYTHSVNVCLYGMALARRSLGMSKQEAMTRFGPGFLLHDLAKTQIPKEVLLKDEPLSEDEERLIRRCPIESLKMVKEFMEVSQEMEEIILQNQERLDGSGYPYGLVGNQISVGARICAIAKIFDERSTNKPTKNRMNSFDALMSMRDEIPHHLDYELYKDFIYLFLPPELWETNGTFEQPEE